jgi:hypothetical protein
MSGTAIEKVDDVWGAVSDRSRANTIKMFGLRYTPPKHFIEFDGSDRSGTPYNILFFYHIAGQ